jgi:hypothetical protein
MTHEVVRERSERERVAKPRRWYAFLKPVKARGRRKLNGKGRIHGKDVWRPFCTIFQECMEGRRSRGAKAYLNHLGHDVWTRRKGADELSEVFLRIGSGMYHRSSGCFIGWQHA